MTAGLPTCARIAEVDRVLAGQPSCASIVSMSRGGGLHALLWLAILPMKI